jgi:outer membrane autotransporter protein
MNRPVFVSHKLAVLGGAGLLALGLSTQSAMAQGQFCPGNFNGGTCISGGQGAVSTAALSSQALSEASQSVTQASTDQAVAAVRRRMDQERAPQQAAAAPAAAPARRAAAPAAQRRVVATRGDLKDPGLMVTKAPPIVSYGPTFAMWGHVTGDWERWRTDTFGVRTLGNDPTQISIKRETTTFTAIGGADWTFNSAVSTWVFGVLAGYIDSRVKFSNSSVGAAADNSTVSSVTGDFSGPTLGGYVTFATGPWSFDLTGKVDFLDIDQSFSEILFVNANPVPNAGSASTDVVNVSITGNANYRIPTSAATWWEPTVGFRYTHSSYGSNAFVLGMDDGEVWRLQGGARFGAEYYWGATQVVTTLTGLVYSDVAVSGLVLNTGAFGGAVVPDEEGEVRGLVNVGMNFLYNPATTAFVNGEVRFGDEYFGVGGKVGVRVRLN